ncbi:MAG: epoxyqueuosine reductase [Chitinophagales bacterium]|nr:MAG: epoxyqueuosine reductase [Chitinophagales bacterium]
MQLVKKSEATQKIKAEAKRLGFSYVGVAKAMPLQEEAEKLKHWLHQNMHGSMHYMARYFDLRTDPTRLVPGAQSVISLMYNYYTPKQQHSSAPKISRYAYGKDYHKVLKKKLKQLLRFIRTHIGEVHGRAFVDSGPVLEKAWAAKSGLGWIGKNSNLIHPRTGSFFFLAELIIDLPLEYDGPIKDYCGSCTACLDACPTGAIVQPYVVDGSKCISYFTIELKEDSIPHSMKGKFGNWVFGCDICQEVCPWNRFARPHNEPEFEPAPEMLGMTREQWYEITEEVFEKLFRHTPLKRAGFKGIKRNLRFIEETSAPD